MAITSLNDLVMNGRNGKNTLKSWVVDTLSHLKDPATIDFLTKEAESVIHCGGLRGNISDAWRSHGYTPEQIPDMFV